jgi:hypothetical protein
MPTEHATNAVGFVRHRAVRGLGQHHDLAAWAEVERERETSAHHDAVGLDRIEPAPLRDLFTHAADLRIAHCVHAAQRHACAGVASSRQARG